MASFGDSVDAVYVEATHMRLIEDAVFFAEQAAKDGHDVTSRNRYARTAIVYSAFHLESLSHLIKERLQAEEIALLRKAIRSDTSEATPSALRCLQAACKVLSNGTHQPSMDGLLDIFEIRNKLFGHPAGFTAEKISDAQRVRVDRQMEYKKYVDFPFTLSQFTSSQAQIILLDLDKFFAALADAVKRPVPSWRAQTDRFCSLFELARSGSFCSIVLHFFGAIGKEVKRWPALQSERRINSNACQEVRCESSCGSLRAAAISGRRNTQN